jgi:hypothetical protein
MANITMSDYVGFIFSEITRARVIADAESRRIAEIYSTDEILKEFSVPRFKIPEMNLAIPVIVSGAKFTTILKFVMEQQVFLNELNQKMDNCITELRIKMKRQKNPFDFFRPNDNIIPIRPFKPINPVNSSKKMGKNSPAKAPTAEGDTILQKFFEAISENPDYISADNISDVRWSEFFKSRFDSVGLLAEYQKNYPDNLLFTRSLAEVQNFVKQNIIVDKTSITNLLVDPETNVVKNTATDATIFQINAKIVEEGIFIKSIKDANSNQITKVVEFE